MYEKPDGCPKCSTRGNAPATWDDETGRGTYACHACGHHWETHWEVPRPEQARGTRIADLPIEFESACCMCGTPCDGRTCSESCTQDLNDAYGYSEERS